MVATVRATLEAEGVQVVVEGDAVTALPFIPLRVLVADKDVDLALALVRDLVGSSPAAREGRVKRLARLFLVAILIAFVVVCGNLLIG